MAVEKETVNTLTISRVYFFDGLRGWAAITVLIHHIVLTFPEMTFLRRTPLRPFIDGTLAVYIFFVLSGIVLSMNYFRNENIEHLSALAIKRIPRLSIPILVSCIIIVPLMKLGLFFNIQAAEIEGGNIWLGGFYNFNGNFIEAIKFSLRDVFFYYQSVNSYNASLWTMPGELSGSFLVIIILLFYKHIPKNNSAWIFLMIYIFILDGILFAFLLGILVSYIYVKKYEYIKKAKELVLVKILVLFLVVAAYFCSVLFGHIGIGRLQQFMYSVGAFLCVALIILVDKLQVFFSTKASKFLGKISFPLYIVHIPIICTFTSYLIVHYGYKGKSINLIIFSSLTIIISLIIAYVFYPIEKMAIKIAGKICRYALKENKL